MNQDAIEVLAPAHLENCRSSRYRGEDQAIPLGALSPSDQQSVSDLYAFLNGILEAADADPAGFLERLDLRSLPSLIERVRRVGDATFGDPRIAGAVHDLRGGPMSVLSIVLTRYVRRGSLGPHTVSSVALAARDHLKIMRNVVEDLDPVRRQQDLLFKKHSLADLSRALRAYPAYVKGEPAVLEVACAADAVMAESCVECGAIDRATYNLLDNAMRHAEAAPICVWLLVIEENLRVAVANEVSAAQRAILSGVDETALFGDFTTTGSGRGLQIVGDLVARAYGIPVGAVTQNHHVGAKLDKTTFITWFHWPLAGA